MMTTFYILDFIVIVCAILGLIKLIINLQTKAKKELLDSMFKNGEISSNVYMKHLNS
jgi:hypothetical protein